jgi:hypothetical protein
MFFWYFMFINYIMVTKFEECYGKLKAISFGYGKIVISMNQNNKWISQGLIRTICWNWCPDKNSCQYKQELIDILLTDKILKEKIK